MVGGWGDKTEGKTSEGGEPGRWVLGAKGDRASDKCGGSRHAEATAHVIYSVTLFSFKNKRRHSDYICYLLYYVLELELYYIL